MLSARVIYAVPKLVYQYLLVEWYVVGMKCYTPETEWGKIGLPSMTGATVDGYVS